MYLKNATCRIILIFSKYITNIGSIKCLYISENLYKCFQQKFWILLFTERYLYSILHNEKKNSICPFFSQFSGSLSISFVKLLTERYNALCKYSKIWKNISACKHSNFNRYIDKQSQFFYFSFFYNIHFIVYYFSIYKDYKCVYNYCAITSSELIK